MPLFLNSPCKVCGTGQPMPPAARFCRNCGRPVDKRTVGRRSPAVGLAVAAVVVLALAVGGLAVLVVRLRAVNRLAPAMLAPVGATVARPSSGPTAAVTSPTPPPTTIPPLAVPARPGDTDLWADPLAVYAGGPPADRLTVHGIGIGTPVADIPPALLDDAAPDHLRDIGGNLYAVDDGRVSEIHIRDPDLLARWPLDSSTYVFARFGEPADTYRGDSETIPTFLYPRRGIHVRWDIVLERITEVTLVRPASVRP